MSVVMTNPTMQTIQKRKKNALECGFEKLQTVFSQYENTVATQNAIALASGGERLACRMASTATPQWIPVERIPDVLKRVSR